MNHKRVVKALSQSQSRSQLFYAIAILPPLLIFFIWLWKLPFGLVDDAFIPMVYARNLAEGYGIVFYPSSGPVEGYTSPLWVFILTLASLVSIPLPWFSSFLSVVFSVVCIFLTIHLYRKMFSGPSQFIWPMLAGIILVADVSFPAWGSSGLETTLYLTCLLLLAYMWHKNMNERILYGSLFVLSLVRPEGPAFLLPLLFLQWWNGKPLKQSVFNACLYFLIPFLLFIAWRWLYFGYPLPNSFYAKHDFGGWVLIHRGFEYLITFFRPRPIFFLALLGLLIEPKSMRKQTLVLWVFLLWHFILVILEGGDHFALHRFMVPALPFLAILSTRGFECLIRRYVDFRQIQNPFKKTLSYTSVLLIALIAIGGSALQLYEYKTNNRYQFSNGARWHLDEVSWARNWAKVGKWLKEKYPPGTKIAVVTAGAIPFYSELPAVDIMGINDVTIAHSPAPDPDRLHAGHEKSNADYVLQHKPKWVQLFPMLFFSSSPFPKKRLPEMLTYPAQKQLWQHPEFQENYVYTSEETPYGVISYFIIQQE